MGKGEEEAGADTTVEVGGGVMAAADSRAESGTGAGALGWALAWQELGRPSSAEGTFF